MLKEHIPIDIQLRKYKNVFFRIKSFASSFFPQYAKKWCQLREEIRNKDLTNRFKSSIFNFITPKGNSDFGIHDINGAKLLTRLWLNFGYLNEHFNITLMAQLNICVHVLSNPKQVFTTLRNTIFTTIRSF